MSIAKKMILLITVSIICLFAVAIIAKLQMNRIIKAANFSNIHTVDSLFDIAEIKDSSGRSRELLWSYLANEDSDQKQAIESEMKVVDESVIHKIEHYTKENVIDEQDGMLLENVRIRLNAYFELREKIITFSKNNDIQNARKLIFEKQSVIKDLVKALEDHYQYNVNIGTEAAEKAHRVMREADWIMALISILGFGLITTLGYLIVKRVASSLKYAVKVSNCVSAGDLTQEIEVTSQDEAGKLLASLRAMNSSLEKIVLDVRQSTDCVASTTQEIAQGNQDLFSRTEQQAMALEKTAMAMDKLTEAVKLNAESAMQASEIANMATDMAVQGGGEVSKVVDTMGNIGLAAKKIEAIISVIDSIAFQTNILALNAAVEAARAGDAGRGFAVVATEVRNLAQRSASAANEIKLLITDSVQEIYEGGKVVNAAGQTITNVVSQVKRVQDVMSEISRATREQTVGIEEINLAISQMDKTTQQNAALVEETASAALLVDEQAQSLSAVVRKFKLKSNEGLPVIPEQKREKSDISRTLKVYTSTQEMQIDDSMTSNNQRLIDDRSSYR